MNTLCKCIIFTQTSCTMGTVYNNCPGRNVGDLWSYITVVACFILYGAIWLRIKRHQHNVGSSQSVKHFHI